MKTCRIEFYSSAAIAAASRGDLAKLQKCRNEEPPPDLLEAMKVGACGDLRKQAVKLVNSPDSKSGVFGGDPSL